MGPVDELIRGVLSGDRLALARVCSLVEDNGESAHRLLAALHPHTGRAHVVGVTGAPGTGKSSLVNALAALYRQGFGGHPPRTVGIVAVDPTSPFSGGALLGDRIRMQELAGDPGVFIRSMATRGSLGGLAWATADVTQVLDAAGFQVIFVETVGAGQAEVDIARTAHTTVVVEVPGMGDDIQAIKAGILEIADIFAVNKADREGADRTAMALEMMLDLNAGPQRVLHHGQLMVVASSAETVEEGEAWRPPICKTVAIRGQGVEELAQAIEAHRAYLQESGLWQQREEERAARALEVMLQEELLRRIIAAHPPEAIADLVRQVAQRALDPYTAVHRLLERAAP
ncbi:MAG: methylmalonyl Co-A mutase-associated GTPase MeaB [Anaerolineae bacterium]|nr:methylmalonyl Co-A mutase-associated GTPase MeaB [Anaerolineae bacterium]